MQYSLIEHSYSTFDQNSSTSSQSIAQQNIAQFFNQPDAHILLLKFAAVNISQQFKLSFDEKTFKGQEVASIRSWVDGRLKKLQAWMLVVMIDGSCLS